jgi:hypothetical protein
MPLSRRSATMPLSRRSATMPLSQHYGIAFRSCRR